VLISYRRKFQQNHQDPSADTVPTRLAKIVLEMYGDLPYIVDLPTEDAMLRTDAKKPRKKERIDARLNTEQKELFERAAALQGRTMTAFVLASAEEAAVRTIQDHELVQLAARDREFFVSSLLNAPTPSSKLRDAAARYKERTGL
jgi:uncharacterized protein (DUF1778 family)